MVKNPQGTNAIGRFFEIESRIMHLHQQQKRNFAENSLRERIIPLDRRFFLCNFHSTATEFFPCQSSLFFAS